MKLNYILTLALFFSGLSACSPDEPGEIAPGIFSQMGEARPSATPEQLETFERGREVAVRRFTEETGLGPQFNVSFCGACHESPTTGGSSPRYRNFLIVGQRLSNGTLNPDVGVNGIQVQYNLDPPSRAPTDENANVFSERSSIPFFGVGLLAEISEESILANQDPDDCDEDGITGRPNLDRGFVGRFGRKSQTVSIEGFIRGPIFNHLGITTEPLREELKAALPVPSPSFVRSSSSPLVDPNPDDDIAGVQFHQSAAPDVANSDDDGVPDPEMSQEDLFDLVSFAMLLGAPEPDAPTPETEEGRLLFDRVNCTGCHVPALAAPRGLIPAYSDLLLHDMGEEMADNVEVGIATASEFRTQPLWGLSATGPYLHDGRADTIEEAIIAHGGEGTRSRQAFEALSETEQSRVIAFLVSLGGSSQASAGLLPPDAPLPAAGDYGAAISEANDAKFLRGRALFDENIAITAGLGPFFNGDSCRACHFDPVIGGSGPTDVDVTRQAILAGGSTTIPPEGSMLHRHSTRSERPPQNADANFFELRQTPSIFGLGLIERLDPLAIMAAQDPDDIDNDGVSGRAHVLGDGRLGLLGWKADVPTLIEFARDALSNEVGTTVPAIDGQTFGNLTDEDGANDPEISAEELSDLAHFMAFLAPPPRTRTDMAAEDRGEAVFSTVRCADCHIPSLGVSDDGPILAYSDFLLHDVAETGSPGLASGDASMTEFRTPPLWGISTTAPYLHNGRAFTLEAAIAGHYGEGTASAMLYSELTDAERGDLLAFLRSL